ncbi:MAG: sigma-54 dependent transcriptional regulator [Proteobacteria bacterium]|nr:sigma-54 dependent transcriptional regulator [Pseudomonadota bacterium]
MKNILLVDDRIHTLKGLVAILIDEGYAVLQAASGAEALEMHRKMPEIDVVLADLKMPHMSGLDLFRAMNERGDAPPFVIMTAFGTVRSAVEALKEGVTEYLIKPLDYEELVIVLEKAVRERSMTRELEDLRERVGAGNAFHDIIGQSEPMTTIHDVVRTVGPTDATVLIRGETGTGKELLARAVHLESRRKTRDLVCLNCAALTESLLEAELFGYVKGAFTGADTDRRGRIEYADKGTLFLDEIGHMSMALQAKLLRFLQEMTFEPVGGAVGRKVDVRLIAATNLNLAERIKEGRFLADLLYRIEVITIELPPLRERGEDVSLLAGHFLHLFARQYDKPIEGLTPEAMDALNHYLWPGNVRELKNRLARAVILSKNQRIGLNDLPEEIREFGGRPAPESSPPRSSELVGEIPADGLAIKDMEAVLIRKTLRKAMGNKSLAAKWLGISRKALYKKMNRFGITSREDDRE